MSLPWQTDRLILRRFEIADAPALSAYRSAPEVALYQSWTAPFSLIDAEKMIDSFGSVLLGEPDEWLQIAVEERVTGTVIGDCALRVDSPYPLSATIGFTLAPESQRQGYAQEMVGRLLQYLKDDLTVTAIHADCDVRNKGSIRLLERLGFTRLPGARRAFFKGECCEEYDFELLFGDDEG